jgi:hypothetical protein
MFIQKEKLHPKILEKKSFQVQQFQAQNHFISRSLSFFLVGFGYLWREQVLKGLFVLFIFFIFISQFVYWGGAIPSPFPRLSLTSWSWIFWGGLFLIFYIFFVRQIYRHKSRFETERERSGSR